MVISGCHGKSPNHVIKSSQSLSNTFFQFKQFTVHQNGAAMKVCTDACLFGAWVARETAGLKQDAAILDIGTGTGLLSLLVAQKAPGLIRAIEIDSGAAQQARENVALSPWAGRIDVQQVSVQAFKPEKVFDLIISNPPFFKQDLLSSDKRKNAAKHSSYLSLNTLIESIADWLSDTGKAYLLIPHNRLDELLAELKRCGLYPEQLLHVRQTPVHGYFRTMICFTGMKTQELKVREMSIKDEDGVYTMTFKSLLADYYLYL